jgi:hypothetical protein
MDTFSFSSEKLRDIQSLILHFDRVNPHCVERPNLGLKKNIFAKFQTILG